MMNKNFKHALAVALITAFVVLALGSASEPRPAPAGPIQVGNSIIGYALVTQLIEQRGWTIGNFDSSGITVSRAVMRGGADPIRSDIVFSVSPDGLLNSRIVHPHAHVNVRQFRDHLMWELAEIRLTFPDTVMADLVAGNEVPQALDNFLGNFQYIAAFMSTLTQVGRTTFVELIVGRTYSWSWPLMGVTENRNPAFDRRFVARFQAQNRNLGSIVTLNVFTNDATLQMIPLRQNVAFSGTLVSVEGNNTFYLLHE